MNGQDRIRPVLGRRDQFEPAVGNEGGADPFGPFGDLVGRDRLAHDRLADHVVDEVEGRVDDAHRDLRS